MKKNTDLDRPERDVDMPKSQQKLMVSPDTAKKPEARISRELQARIGQQLRAMYDDVVNEGVPDHLLELIQRLSDQEKKDSDQG